MSAMYLDYFGLSEPAFRITPQTAWFFAGAQRGALLDALLYAIDHDEGIIKISGEVGVGKTMLCRMLIERLPPDAQIIYLANPSLSPEALLQTVALELGIANAGSLTVLHEIEQALISRYAEGRRVVTIIDEAHAMPRESLEQVRLLSNLESANRKLLQIVLFGQPELDELLALRDMRSLHDRITQHFSLAPLTEKDVAAYLHHRLEAAGYRGPDLFNKQAVRIITHASRGLTRRINILADKTLMAAFADKTHNLSTRHVRRAAEDARYELPPVKRLTEPAVLAIGIACGLTGIGMIAWHYAGATKSAEAGKVVRQAPAALQSTPMPGAQSSIAAAKQDLVSTSAASRPAPTARGPAVQNPQTAGAAQGTTPALGPNATAVLAASRAHIANASDTRYFVQLQRVSASDAPMLDAFLARAGQAVDAAELRIYEAKVDGRMRYGVIFGDYANAKEAAIAIAKMPEWLRAMGIYPRPYGALH